MLHVGPNGFQGDSVHESEGVVVGVERFKYNYFIARVTGDYEGKIYTFDAGIA